MTQDSYNDLPDSVFASRISVKAFREDHDYGNCIGLAEAGLKRTKKLESERGKAFVKWVRLPFYPLAIVDTLFQNEENLQRDTCDLPRPPLSPKTSHSRARHLGRYFIGGRCQCAKLDGSRIYTPGIQGLGCGRGLVPASERAPAG